MKDITREKAREILLQATGQLSMTREQHEYVLKCIGVLYEIPKEEIKVRMKEGAE